MPSRKQNLEIVYQRAMDTIADGDWLTAERILQQLQKVEPNYRDTVKMLNFVKATLTAQQSAATSQDLDDLPNPPEPIPEEPAETSKARQKAEKEPKSETKIPSSTASQQVEMKVEKETEAPEIQPAEQLPETESELSPAPAVKVKKKPGKTGKSEKAASSTDVKAESASFIEDEISSQEHSLPSDDLQIEPEKQAEVAEFLYELEEGGIGLPLEQPSRKEGFRFTRRMMIMLALLGLLIFIGLAYLGSALSNTKPLTMQEKMESLAPPTFTTTPTTSVSGVGAPILPSLTSTPLTPTLTFTPLPPTGTPTITPTLGIGSTLISEVDGMTMVYIPAGEFLMGPAKIKVYMDAFWIDKTEVTNGMYIKCVEEGACPPPSRETYKNPAYTENPVIWVNWFQAQAYCHWTNQRLPSEAEWEKAARGTDGRIFPWGDDPPASNLVNICKENCTYFGKDRIVNDGYKKTIPVGTLPYGASPYGALDMAGNVWEWTADWFDENYYYVPPTANPRGVQLGKTRVIKGGSWTDLEKYIQTFHRDDMVPQYTLYNIGFRCALTP